MRNIITIKICTFALILTSCGPQTATIQSESYIQRGPATEERLVNDGFEDAPSDCNGALSCLWVSPDKTKARICTLNQDLYYDCQNLIMKGAVDEDAISYKPSI